MFYNWRDIARRSESEWVNELRRTMNNLFDEYRTGERECEICPPSVISDTGESFVLQADVPAMTDKDIKLSITQNVLTLTGEIPSDAPEGYSVHRRERRPVSFSRSYNLGAEIDAEKITAKIKDGVLTVSLPKAQAALPKQIQIAAD